MQHEGWGQVWASTQRLYPLLLTLGFPEAEPMGQAGQEAKASSKGTRHALASATQWMLMCLNSTPFSQTQDSKLQGLSMLPVLSKGTRSRKSPHCHLTSGSHQARAPVAEGRHRCQRERAHCSSGVHILPPDACSKLRCFQKVNPLPPPTHTCCLPSVGQAPGTLISFNSPNSPRLEQLLPLFPPGWRN